MSIISPIRCPVISALSWGVDGALLGGGIPVSDKLLLWASGSLQDGATVEWADSDAEWGDPDGEWGFYRRDRYKSPGDFPILITANGDTLTNDWDTTNATYTMREESALVTADALEGPFFFSGGVAQAKTQAEIVAYVSGKASVFFCDDVGLALYSEVLTGSELTDVQAFFSCI